MGVTNTLIEVAAGSVSNRGNVDALGKLKEYLHPQTELFRSMFLYDESFNGYIKDYEGTYDIDKVILDVDVKDGDLTNVRALYAYIIDELSSEYVSLWFSGTGFHIYIADVFKIGPHKDLPHIMKLTLKEKFKAYDIDIIYDRSRLIRAEYSYNIKNNTYKIPIVEDELLNFNYTYFVNKAKEDPRETGKLDFRTPYALKAYWKDDIIWQENKPTITTAKPNGTHAYTSHVTCVQKMYKIGPLPGERHQTVLRMASAWKRNGVTKEGAKALIGTWDPEFNVGEEVDRILDTVYSWEHTGYSCNDHIMEQHCDSICKFYKSKDYTIEVHNATSMSNDFQEFVQKDFEDKSFDLNDMYNIGSSYKFTVGELVTMIGDTKLGKTAFIQNLVTNVSQFKCLYLSLEVNQKLMWRRFCQIAFGLTKDRVTELYAKDNDKFIAKAKERLGHIKILTVSPEINNILDVITSLQPTVIVIDTIDEIRVDYSNDPLAKTQKIVSKLKEIAQQYDVMIFAISHISKSAAFDGNLTRHSAKGDSSIEQKSDKLLGIAAPNPESKARIINSIVARDENGFMLRCYFNHETFQFKQAE
tara:strand:- start:930 stop:2684 length:1755 start_codon:yes stop_codon:yes gene_type:complete